MTPRKDSIEDTKELQETKEYNVRKYGGFHQYPSLREHRLNAGHMWLKGKRIDDNVWPYWRIHNKLYNLTHFANNHPGGKEWINLTQGTDITEAFESSHITTLAEQLLLKYYVKDIVTPRNSPYTFCEDGFYKTFKRKVRPILKEIGCGPTWSMVLLQDGFALTFAILAIIGTIMHSYFFIILAGAFLFMTVNCAHNFFHQRDNWRMYYFDLSILSSHEWRITHGLSHHLFPNTLYDIEITFLEPFYVFLPEETKNFMQRYGVRVYEIVVIPSAIMISSIKRILSIVFGITPLRPENFVPIIELLLMAVLTNSTSIALKLWLVMQTSFSALFVIIGLIAGHHHPDAYHHGDRMRDNPDWGLCQLDAVRERVEVTGSLFLVAISFGDHSLHHLLPTVDHSKLPLLYPAFMDTCKEFDIPFTFMPWWEIIKGKYKQLANNTPNKNPPGYKHNTTSNNTPAYKHKTN